MFNFMKKRKVVSKGTREWNESDDLKNLNKILEQTSKSLNDLNDITATFVNATSNMLVERR